MIQQRFDGSIDFNQNWTTYDQGFGTPPGEYWLGLYNIYKFTNTDGTYKLRVELEDWHGNKGYAEYSDFSLGSPSDSYRLYVSGYTGNIGKTCRVLSFISFIKLAGWTFLGEIQFTIEMKIVSAGIRTTDP